MPYRDSNALIVPASISLASDGTCPGSLLLRECERRGLLVDHDCPVAALSYRTRAARLTATSSHARAVLRVCSTTRRVCSDGVFVSCNNTTVVRGAVERKMMNQFVHARLHALTPSASLLHATRCTRSSTHYLFRNTPALLFFIFAFRCLLHTGAVLLGDWAALGLVSLLPRGTIRAAFLSRSLDRLNVDELGAVRLSSR